jgi:hypothetical protein
LLLLWLRLGWRCRLSLLRNRLFFLWIFFSLWLKKLFGDLFEGTLLDVDVAHDRLEVCNLWNLKLWNIQLWLVVFSGPFLGWGSFSDRLTSGFGLLFTKAIFLGLLALVN